MEKHNKDLEKIKVEKDSLQATLMQIDANYQKLNIEKDSLRVAHNKLYKDYKNMEQTLLKQYKELEELKVALVMYINPKMSYRGNLTGRKQRWTKICRGRWLSMKGYNIFWKRIR